MYLKFLERMSHLEEDNKLCFFHFYFLFLKFQCYFKFLQLIADGNDTGSISDDQLATCHSQMIEVNLHRAELVSCFEFIFKTLKFNPFFNENSLVSSMLKQLF